MMQREGLLSQNIHSETPLPWSASDDSGRDSKYSLAFILNLTPLQEFERQLKLLERQGRDRRAREPGNEAKGKR